jgi:hypothetical protein
LLAAIENPDAFPDLTAEEKKTIQDLRALWAEHPVLSKLGDKGDRVTDRLGAILSRAK